MNALDPILFLDIDDVLCMNEGYGGFDITLAVNDRHENPAAVFRAVFNPHARDILKRVHDGMEGRLRYVVSSTWREALSKAQMEEVFSRGGLGFVARNLHDAWSTPTALQRAMRADEIANWLDAHHQGEAFAIADDTYSGASLKSTLTKAFHPFHGHVVLCAEGVGLQPEHGEPLLETLRKPPSRLADDLGGHGGR